MSKISTCSVKLIYRMNLPTKFFKIKKIIHVYLKSGSFNTLWAYSKVCGISHNWNFSVGVNFWYLIPGPSRYNYCLLFLNWWHIFLRLEYLHFGRYCLIYQKIVQCRETKFKIWFRSTDLLCSFRLWCFFYSINYNDALLSFALNFTNGGCKLIYNVSHILHFCLLLGLFLLFSLHHIWGKLQFLCKPLQNLVWTFKCKVKDSRRSD